MPASPPATGAAATLPFANPVDSGQYAADLDAFLGGQPTQANEDVLSAWVQSEEASFPGFNGLGTTLPLPGSVPLPGNTAGVQEYPSLVSGLTAAKDMMLGQGPQTAALEGPLVADLQSGTASENQLIADIRNSGWWHGPGTEDTYDANAIAGKLGDSSFSVNGAAGAGTTDASANAQTTSIAGSIANALGLTSIGHFLLVVTFVAFGAGLVVVGGYLTTGARPIGAIPVPV